MRRPIVAGNWKMHKTVGQAAELAAGLVRGLSESHRSEVVLCPPFTALSRVRELLTGHDVSLGAQNCHRESAGAFTGEISTEMLADLGCRYTIVGHSERRACFGETDEEVNRKARALLAAGIRPIVCVGETLEQREADRTRTVVEDQLRRSLEGIGEGLREAVIAYEPVWAIGTGRTATAAQAQEVHTFVRGIVAELAGPEIAAGLRIQYGGSVKPSNAAELFAQPDVDGGLIGGASLDVDSFLGIVRAAG